MNSLFKIVEPNEKQIQVWQSNNARLEGINPDKITYPHLLFEIQKKNVDELIRLLQKVLKNV